MEAVPSFGVASGENRQREGSRAEANLSQELKWRGKRAALCGAGHWPLCAALQPEPLIHTGLFHLELPGASLWENRLEEETCLRCALHALLVQPGHS